MKKTILLALAAALILVLAGCGGSPSSVAPAPSVSEPAPPAIQSVDDLNGKKIGVQLGTTGDIYAGDIEGATVERYSKGFEAVQSLIQGKVDAVIIDDQPAKVFASQNDQIKVLDEPFTVEEYAMAFAKGGTLVGEFNQAIAELKADGTLQGLLDYYIGKVEGAKPYESPAGVDTSKGTLVMATNAEFPPYEYREGDIITGFDVDLAHAICDKLGYAFKIEDMAFDSILVAVQSGKADFGAAGMTVTEDRLKSVDFTESYCTASQVVIVKK